MKRGFIFPAVLFFFAACHSAKKEEPAADFFPVYAYLQSQIKHIDTSLYPLIKVVRSNGASDTFFLHRDQFRAEAADFVALPDIASKNLKEDYTESRMYDDGLKRAIFTYTPKEEGEILRQDVTIEPEAEGNDAVKTIFINQLKDEADGSVQKKMLWEVGKRFQVVTTVSKKEGADATNVLEVWWTPPTRQNN